MTTWARAARAQGRHDEALDAVWESLDLIRDIITRNPGGWLHQHAKVLRLAAQELRTLGHPSDADAAEAAAAEAERI